MSLRGDTSNNSLHSLEEGIPTTLTWTEGNVFEIKVVDPGPSPDPEHPQEGAIMWPVIVFIAFSAFIFYGFSVAQPCSPSIANTKAEDDPGYTKLPQERKPPRLNTLSHGVRCGTRLGRGNAPRYPTLMSTQTGHKRMRAIPRQQGMGLSHSGLIHLTSQFLRCPSASRATSVTSLRKVWRSFMAS